MDLFVAVHGVVIVAGGCVCIDLFRCCWRVFVIVVLQTCRIIRSHLFFLHERVSLSTTASCHLAGFIFWHFNRRHPFWYFLFARRRGRVHYIPRRVLRWCKRILVFARSCCITSVCLVWCTYVYVSVFLNFTCTWHKIGFVFVACVGRLHFLN